MNLNIQKFGFWVDPSGSAAEAKDIVSKFSDIAQDVSDLGPGFIDSIPTVWYTELAHKTTENFATDVNDLIVANMKDDFTILLNNYVATVNNLLSESPDSISASLDGISNLSVSWDYTEGSKNLLPDISELGDFVQRTAVPKLERISENAAAMASALQSASDMDAASKSAMISDANTVSKNAKALAESVEKTFKSAAEQEESSVKDIQAKNKERS